MPAPVEYPALPCQRLHFTGPVQGNMLRVVIDPHSKWPEVFVMEDTTAEETFSTLPTWDSLSIWCLTMNHSSRQKLLGNLQLLMVLSML